MNNYEDCIIGKDNGEYYYSRYFHSMQMKLCNMLNLRYGHDTHASIYPSGMCAIDSILQILMINNNWNDANIVYGSELYCDTPRTIKYLQNNYKMINTYKVNSEDDNNVLETFMNKVNKDILTIFFIEGCTNPNGNIFNFELLEQLRNMFDNKNNLKVIIDNTWLSSVIFNPFIYDDVDIVINSLTKYYGGGVSGIMGALIVRNSELGNDLFNYCKVKGLHVCPLYCREVCDNMELMDERIIRTSKMTEELVNYLEQQEKILEVKHPRLESHKSYDRALKYYGDLGPSVFTFKIGLNKSDALDWMNGSKYICSTSFGAPDSRFDQWPSSKKKKTICRFSIGYNDTIENLIEEFNNMLDKL